MNTAASKEAKAMKMLIIIVDIQRLNSTGLTGLSMDFVEICRTVDAAPGLFGPAVVRSSIKLNSFSH